jgi:hypothetical protein
MLRGYLTHPDGTIVRRPSLLRKEGEEGMEKMKEKLPSLRSRAGLGVSQLELRT